MFNRILPRMFLLALAFLFSQPGWTAETPNGFHDITWGTPLSGLTGMVVTDNSGPVKYYRRTGDQLKLGEATLEQLSYGFTNGKFYSVLIEFNGRSNFEKAKTHLHSTYGEAAKISGGGMNYKWGTSNGVSVNLKYSENNQQGYVFIFNKTIAK